MLIRQMGLVKCKWYRYIHVRECLIYCGYNLIIAVDPYDGTTTPSSEEEKPNLTEAFRRNNKLQAKVMKDLDAEKNRVRALEKKVGSGSKSTERKLLKSKDVPLPVRVKLLIKLCITMHLLCIDLLCACHVV